MKDYFEKSPEEIHRFLWQSGHLSYKLWPQQEIIFNVIRGLPKSAQTVVLLCARQFGKSFLGALLAVEDCLQNPDSSVLIVGPTIGQTVDIVHQGMKKIAEDDPGFIRRSKSEDRWYVGSSEIIVGGFDNVNATRQRGKTLYKIYIEEVVDSDPDDYREAIRSDLGPALTHSKSGCITFLSTLPRIPDHPFITETIPQARLYGAFFKYTIDDNEQLSRDQYDQCVIRCGGRDTIEFRREYLCEIVRDPHVVVVPAFDERRHVKRIVQPRSAFYQITIDWGGARDLTVALLHYYLFEANKFCVLAERVWPANTPTSEIVKGLREMEIKEGVFPEVHYPIHQRIVDAPGQVTVDLIVEHKYDCRGVHKNATNDSWQAGINQMAVTFSLDQIEISPDCKFLIQSLRSGTFNKQRTDFERTAALGHCDALAALMYGIRSQDRTNPYPMLHVDGGRIYSREQPLQEPQDAFSVRTFQDEPVKKFGRFR